MRTPIETYENDKFKAEVYYDDDPCMNPRTDWDNFGKMICWHSRYDLGDKHSYSDPKAFKRDLIEQYYPGRCERIDWMVEKHYDKLGEKYTSDDWRKKRQESDAYERELWGKAWDDVCTKHIVILPLFLYDHSGITMSTGAFSCPWDSGQVGYIYADRDMIIKEYGKYNRHTKERARKLMEAEVKTYDMYLTGSVYGYKLYDKHETCESCGSNLTCPVNYEPSRCIENVDCETCFRRVPCQDKDDCEQRWEYEKTDSCWGYFFDMSTDKEFLREFIPKEYWAEFKCEPEPQKPKRKKKAS